MRDLNALQRLTGIDPNLPGKKRSRISVPADQGRTVDLPITVVRQGPGPLVLFTGGSHGDEYEGPIALLKLERELEPTDLVQGGVIIMPIINPPAVDAGTRTSPLDGKNLNRVFPGKEDGSVTDQIAYLITEAVLPHVIAVLDLHAGGRSNSAVPSVMAHTFEDERRTRATIDMLRAFRAPMAILIKEYDTNGVIDKGMLDTTAEEMGLLFGCGELGGVGTSTPETIAVAETGIRNIMKHFGLMRGQLETAAWLGKKRSRLVEALSYRHYGWATCDGIFEPFVEIEEPVEEGQPIGQIHPLEWDSRGPSVQHAPVAGLVFCRWAFGRIHHGDDVVVIANESRRA
ncbi:N-alpha-acetyl diaminobutyric acid deacetylase DoeB [Mesorhizobium sp. M5C.F.Cr.IN.023.01.1.1]|uniref:succinylglutamate desuccinylase/aspartoacylase domain-containing protein n=1 Tax=Mesorhizobium sp. M5C.F.Cr.IN.023.01.1.1 TaxID=2496768 RepID=UPI000FCAA925|nr:succinylglutamate desuccinylase/aspartoacylase family protein [Mesorhizobium sp. M5C.F.Cr.IN.023.01.1.1]RUV68589.1 N-alpha-acetyl diaminobutyric acid deacetylase DoeB [Mesorhizobium sp. M5C.F.Cr.IN.023.01.1.1]